MFFILQDDKEFDKLDIELTVLKNELLKQKYVHQFIVKGMDYFENNTIYPKDINIKEIIPVGSIDFVSKYLKNVHNIQKMNPIEVPNELRLDKFLGRKYKIVKAEDIPKEGYYFLKDVSELKNFTYSGKMEYFFYDEIFDKPKSKFDTRLHLNKNHLFEVSEVVNILSEYRVCILQDKIQGIQFYNGDPTIMPSPDEIKKIKEMVLRYTLNKSRPGAYALDVAIIKSNNNIGRDLIILESCPFTSLGTYGLVGSFLPQMYRQGLDWYIKYNNIIEKFDNFSTFK